MEGTQVSLDIPEICRHFGGINKEYKIISVSMRPQKLEMEELETRWSGLSDSFAVPVVTLLLGGPFPYALLT